MGRNKAEINPNCGKRLRKLLDDNKMTAAELSKRVNCTQQHLSRVATGKSNLSPEIASAIAKVFPGTRVGWLLGIDDCQTDQDLIGIKMQEKMDNCEATHTLIQFAIRQLGYEIEYPSKEEEGELIGGILFCEKSIDVDEHNKEVDYYLINEDGRIEVTNGESEYIYAELVRYAIYLLHGFVSRKNNIWHPFALSQNDIKEKLKDG